MCTVVYTATGEAKTRGGLRELLRVEPVLERDARIDLSWPDKSCLCPCDVEATAELAGYVAKMDDGGDYMLTKRVQP